MKILNGKEIADKILDDLKNKIAQENLQLGLGVVLVGSDEASKIYVSLKGKAAEKVGIAFHKIEMSENSSEEAVLAEIFKLNADPKIDGIIVQLPLPSQLDRTKIIQAIDVKKDVDGFHPENVEAFLAGKERFFPVFPKALLELLRSAGESLKNKKAAIICNSQEFGKTMRLVLEREGILAQYFFHEDMHDGLVDLRDADIVITACGEANLIQGKMLKDGVIIIDGGITRVNEKVVGDVDFASMQNLAGHISPVPGGVGPMTIACLLQNVYLATKNL